MKLIWILFEGATVVFAFYTLVDVRRAFIPKLESGGPIQRDSSDETGIDFVFDNPSWFSVFDVEVSIELVRIDSLKGTFIRNVNVDTRWSQPVVSGGHRMRVALANVLSARTDAKAPTISRTGGSSLVNGEIGFDVRYRTWYGVNQEFRSRYWLLYYGNGSYDWEEMDPALSSDYYWKQVQPGLTDWAIRTLDVLIENRIRSDSPDESWIELERNRPGTLERAIQMHPELRDRLGRLQQ